MIHRTNVLESIGRKEKSNEEWENPLKSIVATKYHHTKFQIGFLILNFRNFGSNSDCFFLSSSSFFFFTDEDFPELDILSSLLSRVIIH